MKLILYLAAWSTLALVVVGLAVYRKVLASRDDETFHFQTGVSRRLHAVDRWGIGLTILTALTGAALLALYVYQSWNSTNQLPD